jgi:hypothetical protein
VGIGTYARLSRWKRVALFKGVRGRNCPWLRDMRPDRLAPTKAGRTWWGSRVRETVRFLLTSGSCRSRLRSRTPHQRCRERPPPNLNGLRRGVSCGGWSGLCGLSAQETAHTTAAPEGTSLWISSPGRPLVRQEMLQSEERVQRQRQTWYLMYFSLDSKDDAAVRADVTKVVTLGSGSSRRGDFSSGRREGVRRLR